MYVWSLEMFHGISVCILSYTRPSWLLVHDGESESEMHPGKWMCWAYSVLTLMVGRSCSEEALSRPSTPLFTNWLFYLTHPMRADPKAEKSRGRWCQNLHCVFPGEEGKGQVKQVYHKSTWAISADCGWDTGVVFSCSVITPGWLEQREGDLIFEPVLRLHAPICI